MADGSTGPMNGGPALRRRPALWLFLLALALRSIVALRTSAMFDDGPIFIELAQRIQEGDWAAALAHAYHPLYPALIAIVEPISPSWVAAGLACSVLGGSLAVVALHRFLCDAYDPRTAWIGALLFAISPYPVRFSADVQSEGVFLAFAVAGVACLWRAFSGSSIALAAGAGGLAGLAYLARPEGAGIVAVGGMLALWRALARDWPWRAALGWIGGLALGFAVVAAPYILALQEQGGGWRLSGKKSIAQLIGLSQAGSAQTPALGGLLALAVLAGLLAWGVARAGKRSNEAAESPVLRLARCWPLALVSIAAVLATLRWPSAMGEHFHTILSCLRPEIFSLAVLGALLPSGRTPRARAWFVWLFVALYGLLAAGLVVNYGYLSRRHVLMMIPLLMGPVAMSLQWLADLLASGWRRCAGEHRNATSGSALAILLLLLAGLSLPKTLKDHREDALAARRVAEWLRSEVTAPGRLASAKRRSAFYAERPWIPLFEQGEPRALAALYSDQVRFIVVGDRLPGAPLTQREEPGFSLEELHRDEANDRRFIVYELVSVRPIRSGAGASESR